MDGYIVWTWIDYMWPDIYVYISVCIYDQGKPLVMIPEMYVMWSLEQRKQVNVPDSDKVHGTHMGPIWGRQDPGGPHVGPMNFAIWGRKSPNAVRYKSFWVPDWDKCKRYNFGVFAIAHLP